MIGKLRPAISSFVNIVAYPFAAAKINPNLFSFLAVPLAIAAAYFISLQQFHSAFIFALLAVSIDLFDGAVARLQNRSTLFGNYFETMVDKAVEIILFIGAAFVHPIAAICALGFSMLASYAKSRAALVIITDNRDWPAIGEHSERMLLLLGGILLSIFGIAFSGTKILELSLWAIALIAAVGSVQRIFYAKKLIAEAEKSGKVLPYLKKN
ncbi:MAG TPA: CDP-alcohol phosphatidyltransferase family protein [archaeon]|nr:CDP-alcohol phosphatidyltransferase family protein [archaeon]